MPNQGSSFPANGAQAIQAATATIQNSWDLFKLSWKLLWKQAFFPLFIALVAIGGSLFFSFYVYQSGIVQTIFQHTHRNSDSNTYTIDPLSPEQVQQILVVIGTLVGYILVMHIFNFFMKAAITASTRAQLTGTGSSLLAGLGAPLRHFWTILGWLLVSGVVGFFLGLRSSNGNANPVSSVANNLSQGIFDSAWKIITFLTMPVIIAEKVGPINAIKRSAQLVRDTWGRQLVGQFGIDGIAGAFTGASFVLIAAIGGGLTYFTHSVTVGLISALVLVSVSVSIGAVRNALVTVYQTVLYQYANKDTLPGFAPDAFQRVFKAR